jgi:2-dehydro-3-deoxygluconokinase
MSKKVVTFGEIMLRLAPQGFLRFSQADNFDVVYGGGESNVAVSLANFGIPVDFVTSLPKNDIVIIYKHYNDDRIIYRKSKVSSWR